MFLMFQVSPKQSQSVLAKDRRLPDIVLDLLGQHLSLTGLYHSLQVCKNWHRTLINSRPTWRSQCNQLGFVTYPGGEEHPRDKCKRVVRILNNFTRHLTVTDITLEQIPCLEDKFVFSKMEMNDDIGDDGSMTTPVICIEGGLICVECPAGI